MGWGHKEPFCKYGYAYSGICDGWEWYEDKLKTAPELDLWKMYGLANEYWHNQYNYWYDREVKNFRDYRRSKGEDLSFKIEPYNIHSNNLEENEDN